MSQSPHRQEPRETRPISQKETTLQRAAVGTDYTLCQRHSVGQIVHNIHKIHRVLQKSNYYESMGGPRDLK